MLGETRSRRRWPATSLASCGLVAANQGCPIDLVVDMLDDYLIINNVLFRSCPKRSPIKAPG